MSNNKLNEKSVESPNYIECKLYGFEGLTLINNKKCKIDNELIKSIFISDNLKDMIVEFQDNVTYTANKKEIEDYLYHICFNLIVKTKVCYCIPYYDVSVIYENNKPIESSDRINLNCSTKIKREVSAESIYSKIIDSPTNVKNNFIKYQRIFKTLHNVNIIAQFMSLYQLLMELLKGNRRYVSQTAVTQYLEDNKDRYDFLYFKDTRKEGKNFKEDCFTYIRNEIGHSEDYEDLNLYKNIGKQINQQLIKNLIIVINDVIMGE